MGKKLDRKITEVEYALAMEIRNASADNHTSIGRCYGLALALAVLTESSTDEELYRVAEENRLLTKASGLFGWTFGD